ATRALAASLRTTLPTTGSSMRGAPPAVAERLDAIAIGTDARPVSENRKLRAFYEADSLHTEIYDALGASLVTGSSVEGDTDFYRRLARETGGPILEVGCG